MEIINLLHKYEYADLRIENKKSVNIKINDEEINAISGQTIGVSVRVLKNGSWGLASSNNISKIPDLLKQADKLATISKGTVVLPEPKICKKHVTPRSKNNYSLEELIRNAKEASAEMKSEKTKNRIVNLSEYSTNKQFFSSAGSEIMEDQRHIYLSASVVVKEGNSIQKAGERKASTKDYSGFNFSEIGRTAVEKANRLLTAAPPPKGVYTVILDPELTGVFSHEALGHASEADSVIERESILADKFNKKIGNDCVTIVDDPTANDFGFYTYDDEGTKAKRTTIVEKGNLVSYLNSLETSKRLELEPNGHARAENYSAFPVVRMSNTYFQKGDSSIDDVLDIKSGYYLKGMKGGSVDIFSGGFMFKAEEAYLIEDGELKTLIRDTTLAGNLTESLFNIESVGKDFGTSPGICGKFGQSVPVSDGGPHIRVKGIKLG